MEVGGRGRLYTYHYTVNTRMTGCIYIYISTAGGIIKDLLQGPLRSLCSLINPPNGTPVPSTASLMVGPVLGFTVSRPLSLVAPPGETLPDDSLFFLLWYSCTWIHSRETDHGSWA